MAKHFEYVGLGSIAFDLAAVLADSIRERIRTGVGVDDRRAPRLSRAYLRRKIARGLKPVRDWTYSGRTLAALQPIQRGDGRIIVGFVSDREAAIAAINNSQVKMFGVSPADRRRLIAAVNAVRNQLVRIAA